MCQGKQDQHIKNCPFYLSFLKKIFKKIVSIVSIVVLKKLKVGKSLIASVCRKKRKKVYAPIVLKKPKGGSLRAVVLKTTS